MRRYGRERGSVRVVSLLHRPDLLSSAITPVEVWSALSRKKREGDLSEEHFYTTLSKIQSERVHWALVEVSEPVLNQEIVQGTGENPRYDSYCFVGRIWCW
jgi:hypothetical protein